MKVPYQCFNRKGTKTSDNFVSWNNFFQKPTKGNAAEMNGAGSRKAARQDSGKN